MPVKAPIYDEQLIKQVYELTKKGLAGFAISRDIKPNLSESSVYRIWAHFDGKEKFLQSMRRREEARLPFAEPVPQAKPDLLSEEQLRLLAKRLRKLPWKHAACIFRSNGKPISLVSIQVFVRRKGGVSRIIERYC